MLSSSKLSLCSVVIGYYGGTRLERRPQLLLSALAVTCRCIRPSLPTDAWRTLAAAFIASRVDYCNGLLYGVSSQLIRRLQMVLNAAARLVVDDGRYEHITPALRDMLHWLPVPQWIQFKIAISAFDCIREHCPAYFNNECIPVAGISGRANLRPAERHCMLVPSTRTQLGRRSFDVAAPAVWNALPSQLRYHPLVVDNLELGWKPISSHKPMDTSENFCWRVYYFTLHLHYITLLGLLLLLIAITITTTTLWCKKSKLLEFW